uniref:Uncharacterized protein n=1 Tax=Alexandrium monilatum TaxID=311494 RepID=A0A7S4VCC7_9DINO
MAAEQRFQERLDAAQRGAASAVQDAAEVKHLLRDAESAAATSASLAEAARLAQAAEAREADSLRCKFEATAAEVAALQTGLARERESADAERRLREEEHREMVVLLTRRHGTTEALLAHREQAARGVVVSLLASQVAGLMSGAFSAWRELCAVQAQPAAPAAASLPESASTAAQHGEDVSRTLIARREELARHVLAGSLAAQLEGLVRGFFSAWRDALEQQSSSASVAVSSIAVAQLQGRLEAATAELEAASCRTAGARAFAQAEEAAAAHGRLRAESTRALLARQRDASRCVLAVLISSGMELLVQGAFRSWRDLATAEALRLGQEGALKESVAVASEERVRLGAELAALQAQASMADRRGQELTSELREMRGSEEEVKLLMTAATEARQEDAAMQRALSEKESAVRALSSEVQDHLEARTTLESRLRSMTDESSALLCQLEEAEGQTAMARHNHVREYLHDGAAAAHCERRLSAVSGLLAVLLAERAECCLRGAFLAWRDLGAAEAEASTLRRELQQALVAASAARSEAAEEGRRAEAQEAAVAAECRSELRALATEKAAALEVAARSQEEDSRALATVAAEASRLREALERAEAVQVPDPRKAASRLHAGLSDHLLARREDASQRVLAAVIASQMESIAASAFHVWRLAATTSPVLPALGEDPAAGSSRKGERAVRDDSGRGLGGAATGQAEAASLVLMRRREGALCKLLADLFATQLERLAQGVLYAWREAFNRGHAQAREAERVIAQGVLYAWCEAVERGRAQAREAERVAGEFAALREELRSGLEEKVAAAEARERAEARLRAEADEASRLAGCLDTAREETRCARECAEARLRAEEDEASRLAGCLERARAEARSAEERARPAQADLPDRALMALLIRREHTSQGVICGLLARQSEALLHSTLWLWHDTHVLRRQKCCRKVLAAWCELCASLLQALLRRVFHPWAQLVVARLLSLVRAFFSAWRAAVSPPSAAGAMGFDPGGERREVASSGAASAAPPVEESGEVDRLRREVARLTARMEEMASQAHLAKQVASEENGSRRPHKLLAAVPDGAPLADFRGVVSTLLASQLEACVRGAFVSWRAATPHVALAGEGPPAGVGREVIELRAALREAVDGQEAAQRMLARVEQSAESASRETRAAGRLAEEAAAAASLLRARELAARQVLLAVLASQLESLVSGAFGAWRGAARAREGVGEGARTSPPQGAAASGPSRPQQNARPTADAGQCSGTQWRTSPAETDSDSEPDL